MKDNELSIVKKISFKKIFLQILRIFNKKNTYVSNKNKIIEKVSEQKKTNFLKMISFKPNQQEALLNKVKNDPNILKSMSFEELKELNKTILNWKKYLNKRLEIAKKKT